jgi:transposase
MMILVVFCVSKTQSMANKTIGSIMIREIIRMKEKGFSNNKISQNIGKSRTTVLKYLSAIQDLGFGLNELLALSDKDLSALLETPNDYKPNERQAIHTELFTFFPYVDKELKRVGVTRGILWQEYKKKYPEGVMYSRFCEQYAQYSKKSEGYMPTTHKAGEKLFIDYAGKKLHIIDKETGEIKSVEVFVATLGASQYTYLEASFTQQIPDFITSVQNALYYFGGVPACIVPDNLKSAVRKSNRYEPFINEQFACFAAHYDTSIMPARALKPKDKSLVEGAVNIAYTRIYAALRNSEFYHLNELNNAIKKLLETYNKAPFQKKSHNRTDLFESLEKEALKPLPISKYELRTYKIATVQKNCHVYFAPDKNYYSVPHAFIGKKVKMILCENTVEIYHNQSRIAVHIRSRKAYSYQSIKEHMPVSHTYNNGWNTEYFMAWANKIGTATAQCVEKILNQKQYPEQNYKSCAGVLNLACKTSKERLENACKRALFYNAIGYNAIKNILEKGLDKQHEVPILLPLMHIDHENIRGAEYYN